MVSESGAKRWISTFDRQLARQHASLRTSLSRTPALVPVREFVFAGQRATALAPLIRILV